MPATRKPARKYVRAFDITALPEAALFEKDEDHEAYDFITAIGGLYAIEATPT